MNKGKKPDDSFICQKVWTRKFVTDTFPKNWVNKEWKAMNSRVGVEREKALLPATMAVVEQRKEVEQMKLEVQEIEKMIRDLTRRRNNLSRQIQAGGSVTSTSVNSAAGNGRKCPDEECRGYLSTQWKCGMCDKWTCPDCHVIKGTTRDAQHTCDPDVKATAQFLAKDTKPCPKCSTLIHKIEGCDQMWCTQCHTAFSWRRGTIETRIHNPHYYEWQRQQSGGAAPRNLGDFECGRDLADQQANRFINTILSRVGLMDNLSSIQQCKMQSLTKDIPLIIRKTVHLQRHDGDRFRTDNLVDNLEVRVRYLNKDITDKQFASKVHTAYKAHEKKRDIANVIQLQVQGVTDIIYRIADFLKRKIAPKKNDLGDMCYIKMKPEWSDQLSEMFSEIKQLTDYSNGILEEHANTYGCKTWKIAYIEREWRVLT
ncbi:hypothetical protein N8996_07245 [Candidatus Poseidonia alphae]|nr:hypothetical protein [Candidatus Poseidonia alphae]